MKEWYLSKIFQSRWVLVESLDKSVATKLSLNETAYPGIDIIA